MTGQRPTREQIAKVLHSNDTSFIGVSWGDLPPRYRATLTKQASAVLALFPQPTPSACICGPQSIVSDGPSTDCPTHGEPAAPPNIADMAPGTMCDANGCSARPRWISAGGFHWCDEHRPFPSRPLDPSTIRDVTPPPTITG